MTKVPEGWVEVELGEVFSKKRGSALVPAKQPDQRFELYSVPAFQTGRPERPLGAEIGSAKQTVAPGTVLLCRINPRINRVWMIGQDSHDPQIASTEWIALQHVEGIAPRFLMYALRAPAVRRHLTASVSGVGGSLMRVRMAAAWRTRVPLAPLPEQRRIVARIESFSHMLDEGMVALKRAEANLELYRASALKAAVEGRLTEQWRRKNLPEETGPELLARILVERRQRWEEEQIAKYAAKGRKPPKNWKTKYKEPVAPDTGNLPELPEGWCWATVDQVSESVQYGSSTRTSSDHGGVPVLRMGNIHEGKLNLDNLKYLPLNHSEFPKLLLRDGDLLFNRTNSAELVGKISSVRRSPGPLFVRILSDPRENATLRPVLRSWPTL